MKTLTVCTLFLEFTVMQCIEPQPSTTTAGDGPCPPEWEKWEDHCYYFNKEGYVGWEPAIQECKKKAGSQFASRATLASVHTAAENEFIKTLLTSTPGWNLDHVWLGLSKKAMGADYLWTDGSPMQYYTNWAPQEPKDREEGEESCVGMNRGGTWNSHDCTNTGLYHVCKASVESLPTTHATRDDPCPRNWEPWGESCYYTPDKNDELSWEPAIQKCKVKAGRDFARRATLASINTATENNFIKTTLLGSKNVSHAWIGLSKKGADYLWTDGSPTQFRYWATGQPNNVNGDEDCVEMILHDTPGMWNDRFCGSPRHYMCEAPMRASSDQYIGCYRDTKTSRDLSLDKGHSGSRTIENCIAACKAISRQYAGLSEGGHCWCGNSYGLHGTGTECLEPCTGNSTQKCGGPLHNSVYRVCPNKCLSYSGCSDEGICNSCKDGYWGDKCEKHCNNCLSTCDANGHCIDGAAPELTQQTDAQAGETVELPGWLFWVLVTVVGVIILTLVIAVLLLVMKKSRGRRSDNKENYMSPNGKNARDDIHPLSDLKVHDMTDDEDHHYCRISGDDHYLSIIHDSEEMNGKDLSPNMGTSPAQPQTTISSVPAIRVTEALDSEQYLTPMLSDPKPPLPHRVPSQTLTLDVHDKAVDPPLGSLDPSPTKLPRQKIKQYIMTADLATEHQALTIEARNQAGSKPAHLAEKQSISSSNVNPLLRKRVVECSTIPSTETLTQFWSQIDSHSAIGASALVLLIDKNKTMDQADLRWLPTADEPILLPTGLEVIEKRRQEVDGITCLTLLIRVGSHAYDNIKYVGHVSTYMDMTSKHGKQHDCQVLLVDPTSPAGAVAAWRILQNTLHFTACSLKRYDIDVFAVCMFLLDQAHAFDGVDVPAAVDQLRKQHSTMISNVESYYFIYKVLEVFWEQ